MWKEEEELLNMWRELMKNQVSERCKLIKEIIVIIIIVIQ